MGVAGDWCLDGIGKKRYRRRLWSEICSMVSMELNISKRTRILCMYFFAKEDVNSFLFQETESSTASI